MDDKISEIEWELTCLQKGDVIELHCKALYYEGEPWVVFYNNLDVIHNVKGRTIKDGLRVLKRHYPNKLFRSKKISYGSIKLSRVVVINHVSRRFLSIRKVGDPPSPDLTYEINYDDVIDQGTHFHKVGKVVKKKFLGVFKKESIQYI